MTEPSKSFSTKNQLEFSLALGDRNRGKDKKTSDV